MNKVDTITINARIFDIRNISQKLEENIVCNLIKWVSLKHFECLNEATKNLTKISSCGDIAEQMSHIRARPFRMLLHHFIQNNDQIGVCAINAEGRLAILDDGVVLN